MNSVALGPSKADSSAAAKQIPCLFEIHASLPRSQQIATGPYTHPRTPDFFFQAASSVQVLLLKYRMHCTSNFDRALCHKWPDLWTL